MKTPYRQTDTGWAAYTLRNRASKALIGEIFRKGQPRIATVTMLKAAQATYPSLSHCLVFSPSERLAQKITSECGDFFSKAEAKKTLSY